MTNQSGHITKRFDLNVGKRCNERCSFCYYLDEIESGNTADLSTSEIKDILKLGRRWGKTRVDFTGGEPSIRRDLPELLDFAREIGYETRCMITNGLVSANKDRLAGFQQAGLNDILVSLHASDAATHDALTQVPGSYAKVLATIGNARELGINLRINHVVSNLNYQRIGELTALAADYQPDALNFLFFNPTRDAMHAERSLNLSYRDITTPLLGALEKYSQRFASLNIRHLPFCLVRGYESHVKTMWQLQYERVEWDWCMDIIHKRGAVYMYAAAIYGMLHMLRHPRFYRTDWNTRLHDSLQMARIRNDRVQPSACRDCRLRYICDGLPREYVHHQGGDEVSPYLNGSLVLEPDHFIPLAEREDAAKEGDVVRFPGTPYFIFGMHSKRRLKGYFQKKKSGKRKKSQPVSFVGNEGAGRRPK